MVGSGPRIFWSQRVSATDVVLGNPVQVPSTGTDSTQNTILGLVNGDFVQAWTTSIEGDYQIVVQQHNAGGSSTGFAAKILGGAGIDQQPRLAALANGGYVLTFHAANGTVGVQVYAANGNEVGGLQSLTGMAGTLSATDNKTATVLALVDGGFAVGWQGAVIGQGTDIFVQRFDASGVAVGPVQRSHG